MKPTHPLLCEMHLMASSPYTTVRFTLTNTSNNTLRVLPWHSAWEGWRGRFLSVTVNDEPVEYQGPMIKRPAPSKEAFKTLSANDTWQSQLTLNDVYDIKPGKLHVQYTGLLTYLNAASEEVEIAELTCRLEAEV